MKARKEEVFIFGWINVVVRNYRFDDIHDEKLMK
jgi:hypothetical protein